MKCDLSKYPSKVSFSHKLEDLATRNSLSNISTIGRLYRAGNSYFISYKGIDVKLNVKNKNLKDLSDGDLILVKGDYDNIDMPSIQVRDIILCSKCINAIPKEVSKDYGGLNLLLNKRKKETILFRAMMLKKIREILCEQGFIEVETPILQYYPDSAPVATFSTRYSDGKHDYHLRICPEEYLKRLILGIDKVYEIAKCFRNSDKSKTHSPEFTMLEFYSAFTTYENMMNITEELIEFLALQLNGTTKLNFRGCIVDVKKPWKRISVRDAGVKYCGFDPLIASPEKLRKCLGTTEDIPKESLLKKLIKDKLEPVFEQPTFLTNYPIGVGAPDKTCKDDPLTNERAEVFLANGFELANLGSINNDPVFLERHNRKNLLNKFGADVVDGYLDKNFLYELGFGLPPLACSGIGIDRLVMLLRNIDDINDTIVYPFNVGSKQ